MKKFLYTFCLLCCAGSEVHSEFIARTLMEGKEAVTQVLNANHFSAETVVDILKDIQTIQFGNGPDKRVSKNCVQAG